jgi:hypothetical protein
VIIELQQNIKPDTLHQLKALLTINQVAFSHVEKQNIIVAPKISNKSVLSGVEAPVGLTPTYARSQDSGF